MQGKIVKGIAGFYYVHVVESGVYECKAKGSVEEKIQKIQESKKELLEQVVGEGAGQLGNMSKEDFLEFLE